MRMVIGQYGKLLLSVMVGAVMFGLCLSFLLGDAEGQSLQKLAAVQVEEIGDYTMAANRQAFAEFASHAEPVVTFCYQSGDLCALKAGEAVKVSDCFYAADSEGVQLEVQVLDVSDSGGNDRSDVFNKDAKELCFDEAGIYRLTVCAEDGMHKKTVRTFDVPIEEAGRQQ